ncbi:MAG: histidine phosphatase family protein [Microthrixaceae bacterium]|nr:histidine phosphatase family protein [Microthrixaceae bacterium]MCB1010361.1 histidine phosphatase family protein [Microthrixaceae bacterium]MCO5320344.1 histidine phosphatase family protein [Microthrixaceae bacterium]
MAENDIPSSGESPVDRFDDDGGVPQRRFEAPEGSTTIYLVRHGATQAAHPDRPFPTRDGHGDPPLAPEGIDQARRVGERLVREHRVRPFSAVYVTSLRRTHETAAPFLDASGLPHLVEADLREVHLGDYEGGLLRLKGAEGDPLVREVYTSERWDVIPGAESWDAFQGRCVSAVERITNAHRGERVLAVVHGGVIGAVLAHVARSRNFAFVGADNSSVSEIVHIGDPIDRWVLRRFNDVTHLD